MPGYIEFSDENGTYRIIRENPPITLDDVIEDMVIPILLAAGYSHQSINDYYIPDPTTDIVHLEEPMNPDLTHCRTCGKNHHEVVEVCTCDLEKDLKQAIEHRAEAIEKQEQLSERIAELEAALVIQGEANARLRLYAHELEKKLGKVFPQVYDAVIGALNLTPTEIQKIEKVIITSQHCFGC